MENCVMDDVTEYNDINTLDQYQLALDAGCSKEEALKCCYENSRDNARTPMQWNSKVNAGFSTGTPWLKVNPNYVDINVEVQKEDESSVLSYYKELIALRKADEYRETFTYGKFEAVFEEKEGIFAYQRISKEQQILVAANFGKEAVNLRLPGQVKRLLLSNRNKEERQKIEGGCTEIVLDSCDAVVLLL